MSKSRRLSQHEVDGFKEHCFERDSAIFLQSHILAHPEEAYETLVAGCHAAADGQALIKVFVDGMQVVGSRHSLLPREDEITLDRYQSRLLQDTIQRDFAIVLPSIQVYSPLICDRARSLLAELLGDDWLPAGSIDLELFFGRYEYTPGGIHKEPRSNLHCIVAGQKSMIVWPEATWESSHVSQINDLRQLEQAGRQHEATILAGDQGDILYWPSNYWHIGRAPKLSIGINIAIYLRSDPFELLTKAVREQLWGRFQTTGLLDALASCGTSVCELPETLQQQLTALQLTANSTALATSLTVEWMAHVTSLGFRPLPGRLKPDDLSGTILLARTEGGRLCWNTIGSKLIYSGNGHIGQTRAGTASTEILELLHDGYSFTPQQMIGSFSNDLSIGEIWSLLEDLYSMGVIAEV